MPRRFAYLAAVFAALLACAPASAAQPPRIINGSPASEGEYPAQGFLELATADGTFVCGGSLVGNRSFLTAAHCATEVDTTTPLDPTAFRVTLGKVDKDDFAPADEYGIEANTVHPLFAYTNGVPRNDAALLTLTTPAPPSLEPLRLVESAETGLWAAGDTATVIGWGTTEQGQLSDELLEATVPMLADADCAQAWDTRFSAATMVCAGGGSTDTCGGDSGGPLMVSDGAFPILAGLTSWGANDCGTAGVPGVYTRLGAAALNDWVRGLVPMARASVSDTAVDPDESVTFSVTANHPGIPGYFTNFSWDFDSDGTLDASGANPTHAYPADGLYVARVLATGAGDTATDKVALQVGDPTPTPTPTPTPQATPEPRAAPAPPSGPSAPPTPPPAGAVVRVRQATILVTGRPRVRGGRFTIRVRFARTVPAGTAVVELVRARRVIGIARTRVVRGSTKRIRVKLTPSGRRLLRRSRAGRLTVTARVRVGRRVLRSKKLTVQR